MGYFNKTITDKRFNPNWPQVIELAYEVTQAKRLTLETEAGWFDFAEMDLYWNGKEFEATITTYSDGRTETGPTWYDKPETIYNEATETECFVKIKALADWAKSHGFDICKASVERGWK